MSLGHGRPYLAIPGPSVMPDRVLNAMHRAAPNIYEGGLIDMVDTLYPDLRTVAQTSGNVAIYIGNGHAAWEAALVNVFSRGDKALALATGRFGHGWSEAAQGLGIKVELLDFGRQKGVDANRLEAALRADRQHEIKAVLSTQTDTASSIRTDIAELRRVLDACGHPALLMVDCIASLGCDRFEMDHWGVDVMIAASQKGLMTPPGLSFVWFNERAMEHHESAGLVTPYWNWKPRVSGESFYQKFDGTAPTHHLFGLREALNMLVHEEGIKAAWARHAALARAVWVAVECWGQGGPVYLNIADPGLRSHAVTSIGLGSPDAARLRRWLEETAGVTLGIGLGMETEADPKSQNWLRIAHMGHVNAHMVLGLLGAIEAAMQALSIPHGQGAISAAARIIAIASQEP